VHPITTALPLRAALERSDRPAAQTKIWAVYRVVGDRGAPKRVQLTAQNRRVQVAGSADTLPAKGDLFERLIEPASLGLIAPAPADSAEAARMAPQELEYWFETADDQTSPARLKLVQPPAVASASVT